MLVWYNGCFWFCLLKMVAFAIILFCCSNTITFGGYWVARSSRAMTVERGVWGDSLLVHKDCKTRPEKYILQDIVLRGLHELWGRATSSAREGKPAHTVHVSLSLMHNDAKTFIISRRFKIPGKQIKIFLTRSKSMCPFSIPLPQTHLANLISYIKIM